MARTINKGSVNEKQRARGTVVTFAVVFFVLFLFNMMQCADKKNKIRADQMRSEGRIIDVSSFDFDGSKLTIFGEDETVFIALSPQIVRCSSSGSVIYIRPLKSRSEIRLKFNQDFGQGGIDLRDDLRKKADEVGVVPGANDMKVFVF